MTLKLYSNLLPTETKKFMTFQTTEWLRGYVNRNVAHTGVSSSLAKNTKSDNTSAISKDKTKSSNKDVTSFDHEGSKPRGSLSVSHHGLKKF